MKRRSIVLGCVSVIIVALSVSAQAESKKPSAALDAISARKSIMKTVGFAAKTAGGMARGKTAFDPVSAELAMRAINAAALAYRHYFPADSKTGGETQASPKIWDDMKRFLQIIDELEERSSATAAAAKKGLEAFKVEFGKTVKACKQCHEAFRIKKKQ